MRHHNDPLGASGASAGLSIGFVVGACECGDVRRGVGDGAEGVVPCDGVYLPVVFIDAVVVRGEAGDVIRVTRAVDGGCFAGVRGPGANSTVGGAGEEGWGLGGRGNYGGGVSLMTLHDADGFGGGRREVVEITRQGERNDHVIRARSGPCHADLVIGNTDHPLIGAHAPGVDRFTGFGVPDLHSLVGTAGGESF